MTKIAETLAAVYIYIYISQDLIELCEHRGKTMLIRRMQNV